MFKGKYLLDFYLLVRFWLRKHVVLFSANGHDLVPFSHKQVFQSTASDVLGILKIIDSLNQSLEPELFFVYHVYQFRQLRRTQYDAKHGLRHKLHCALGYRYGLAMSSFLGMPFRPLSSLSISERYLDCHIKKTTPPY